jgi:antitoxin (DNA-binding transcriptional repressor) of toxin-antitoxin stability system
MYAFSMSTVTVSEARATLPEILERVLAGEEVTLTRHGRPVAVVVRPDTLRTRRADDSIAAAARVRERLEQSRRIRLDAMPAVSEQGADSLLANVRAARSHR